MTDMRDVVCERIRELAACYTPDWRFSTEQPDLGSSLALLFAEQMGETLKVISELQESHRVRFYNKLGAGPMAGAPSGGYMTFNLVKPDMPPSLVPKGTGVEGMAPGGSKVRFETLEEVAVSPSRADPEPYPEGDAFYLRFDLPLTGSLHNLLAVVNTGIGAETRRLIWEYESESGFCPFPAEDGSFQLTCTGIIRFTKLSGMAERTHRGKRGFWIRIRNELGEPFACPVRFYMNGAAVAAEDGGRDKNLPPMSALKLTKTVGFVTDIRNPDVLYGGTDTESESDAMERMGARIRHRFQAVTAGDMESVARESSLNIEKVKCFPGYDEQGLRSPGCVTLTVLQKDYEGGRNYFYRLRTELLNRLKEVVSPCLAKSGRLFVAAPWFIHMDVEVTAVTGDYGRVTGLQAVLEDAVSQYLNPVTGGYDGKGWEFGCLPGYGQIKHMLQRIGDVAYIRRMSVRVHMEVMGERREMNLEDVEKLPYILPLSGVHEVTVIYGAFKDGR